MKTDNHDIQDIIPDLRLNDESNSNTIEENEENSDGNNNTNSTIEAKKSKRHGARNQHRHKIFIKWLAQTFPSSFKNAKDLTKCTNTSCGDKNECNNNKDDLIFKPHILDVAGGKGELSARMVLCHQLNVVMVDPRPANLLQCFHKNVFRSLPKKWQEKMQNNHDNDRLEPIVQRRFKQITKHFPSDANSFSCNNDKEPSQLLQSLSKDPDLLEAVKNATLIIGMHADGATEAIVDIALQYRKPFVVIPCCVFPNFFQQRFIPMSSSLKHDVGTKENEEEIDSVKPVRTHEDFCNYLALKDSHFNYEILPFPGRNIAVWWDGLHRDDDIKTTIQK